MAANFDMNMDMDILHEISQNVFEKQKTTRKKKGKTAVPKLK